MHYSIRKSTSVLQLIRHYGTKEKYKPFLIKNKWCPVIGLEVHAQINSNSKLFSRVSTKFGGVPNSQLGVFEAAHPGTLPVLNRRCVEAAVKTALALNAELMEISNFDRKHYFYPDLPAGYQITQRYNPIAKDGKFVFDVEDPDNVGETYPKSVDLLQLQLEEDSGKSIHSQELNRILVDLNRAGIPLMELVFGPDLNSADEAVQLVEQLILILKFLNTCSCKMNEGALRIDANVSIHRPGESLGTRTELKNLGSVNVMRKSINYEIDRQISVIERGDKVINETRSFVEKSNKTISMRDKEIFQDYRFMPEPNLPPLRLYDSSKSNHTFGSFDIANVKSSLPELPAVLRHRLINQYGIEPSVVKLLLKSPEMRRLYLDVITTNKDRKHWVVKAVFTNFYVAALNSCSMDIKDSPVTSEQIGEMVDLYQDHKITGYVITNIIKLLFDGDTRIITKIVDDNNWYCVVEDNKDEHLSEQQISELIELLFEKHPQSVKFYLNSIKKQNKKKQIRYKKTLMNKLNIIANNKGSQKLLDAALEKKINHLQ